MLMMCVCGEDGHMCVCVYMESIDDAHACAYGEDNDMFMCVWIGLDLSLSLSLLCLYVNKLPFVLPKC